MNIVILGKAWNAGKIIDIAQALIGEGLTVTGIVAMKRPKPEWSLPTVIQKIHREGFKSIWQRVSAGIRAGKRMSPTPGPGKSPVASIDLPTFCRKQQIRLERVNDLNGTEAQSVLQAMKPDLLVLGGTPIIRAPILDIPTFGTVNVHMGILPRYRGRNVAEWAVFENAPVGLTVHLVDPGVDTGAILQQRHVDVSDCPSITAMRQKLSYLQHRFLAKCASAYLHKQLRPQPQTKTDGKQYYEMHPVLKRVVEARLASGYRPSHRNPLRDQLLDPC